MPREENETILLVQRGADRGNFLRRKFTHKFRRRDSFFFFFFTLAFEGKLKAARGKGAGMLDAVNEFLPYRINSSRLI